VLRERPRIYSLNDNRIGFPNPARSVLPWRFSVSARYFSGMTAAARISRAQRDETHTASRYRREDERRRWRGWLINGSRTCLVWCPGYLTAFIHSRRLFNLPNKTEDYKFTRTRSSKHPAAVVHRTQPSLWTDELAVPDWEWCVPTLRIRCGHVVLQFAWSNIISSPGLMLCEYDCIRGNIRRNLFEPFARAIRISARYISGFVAKISFRFRIR